MGHFLSLSNDCEVDILINSETHYIQMRIPKNVYDCYYSKRAFVFMGDDATKICEYMGNE